jgi:hypothetical protein
MKSTWKVAIRRSGGGEPDRVTVHALHLTETTGGSLLFHDSETPGMISAWPPGGCIVAVFRSEEWIMCSRVDEP